MDRSPDAGLVPDTRAIGAIEGGELIAGVAYFKATNCDVQLAVAALPGRRWLSRRMLEIFFGYVFYPPPLGMGKRRCTAIIHKRNKHSRDFNERLGWKLEGSHRHAFPNDDAVSYGMYADNCRWIKQNELR